MQKNSFYFEQHLRIWTHHIYVLKKDDTFKLLHTSVESSLWQSEKRFYTFYLDSGGSSGLQV